MVQMKPRVILSDPSFKAADILKDESYQQLTSIADVIIELPENEEEMCRLSKEAVAMIVGDFPITPKLMDSSPKLKIVSKCGVGYDNIDVGYATKKGIFVTNVPSVLAVPVAEHALMLMLAVSRKLVLGESLIRADKWWDFFSLSPGFQLNGKTLGIVGFGAIGSRLAEIARTVFNTKILAFDPYISPEKIRERGAESAALEELLKASDIVSVHVPLSPATTRLIGEKELHQMKPSAVLINTSRGRVLDEQALVKALNSGMILAAGLDVFEEEPLPPNSPLLKMQNVTMTPHSAAYTSEATKALWLACVRAAIDVLNGRPPSKPANILNPEILKKSPV